MDDWDPRKHDYEDENFNSYDRGPGQNISRRQDKSAGQQLYITGIPKDLSHSGLENLFSRAGNVLHANVCGSKQQNSKQTYGFVTMENLMQAEDAIRQLNNFKLGENTLRVKIAMSDAEKKRRKQKQMEDEEFLSSLPSGRNVHISMRGSDSDSDRGSIKSSRSRNVNNGYNDTSMPALQNQFDSRPSLLGAYPGCQDSRVVPDPNLIVSSSRNMSMNDRFVQLEQLELDGHSDISYDGAEYPMGRGRGRGRRRDMPPGFGQRIYNNNRYENYGRGSRFQEDYGGGYRPMRGRGIDQFGQGYGSYNGYGDNRNVRYQTYGYGRPNYTGDYVDNFSYDDYSPNPSYRLDYDGNYYVENAHHSTPNFRGRSMQQFGGGNRQGRSPSLNVEPLSVSVNRKEKEARKVKVEARPCNVCQITGSFQCSKCKTPYCSDKCQKDDWSRHRLLCSDLSRGSDFTSKFEEQFDIDVGDEMVEKMKTKVEQSTGDHVTYQRKPDQRSNNDRRPKDGQQRNKQQSPKTADGSKSPNKGNQHSKTKQQASPKQAGMVSPKTKQQKSPTQAGLVSPKARQASPKAASVSSVLQKGPVCPATAHSPEFNSAAPVSQRSTVEYKNLPIGIETEVLLVYVTSPYHFAVEFYAMEEMQSKIDLGVRMNEVYKSSTDTVQTPQVGKVYATQFSADNSWYRVRVDSIDRDTVDVTYIDYGNTEKIPKQNLRHLQPDMTNLKAQTIICSLDGVQPKENAWPSTAIDKLRTLLVPTSENQSFYQVTALSECGHLYQVQIKDFNGADVAQSLISCGLAKKGDLHTQQPSAVSPGSRTPLMLSDIKTRVCNLSVGDKVTIATTHKESPALFYAQIVDEHLNEFFTFMQDLNKTCEQPSVVPYRPNCVGEIVVAKFTDGQWYRAEVVSISDDSATLNFIDYGNREVILFSQMQKATSLCAKIPRSELKLKLVGVPKCRQWPQNALTLFDKLLPPDNPMTIEVKSFMSDIIEVDFEVENGSFASNLIASCIAPQVTESKVMACSVPIETLNMDGITVEIVTPLINLNKLYVQKRGNEIATEMYKNMSQKLNDYCNSDSTPYCPIKGELVCSKFSDNVWYRAEVLDVDKDNFILQFVDYGNESVADPEIIRRLIPSLAELPRQGICCTLVGVDLSSINEEQLAVLHIFLLNTNVVKVQVCKKTGESYAVKFLTDYDNTNINDLLSAAASSSPSLILASDLDMISIPTDGSKIDALIMESIDMKLINVQLIDEKIRHKLQILAAQLKGWCQSNSAYVPVKGELVCALFVEDKNWYRAEVLEVNDNYFTVLFVDYGNKADIKSTDIRKIIRAFSVMPKQSVCCYMIGVDDLRSVPANKLSEFSDKAMSSEAIKLQGLARKDGYYDVILYTKGGENLNELLQVKVESKVQTSAGQNTSRCKDEIIMASSLPEFNVPVDGQTISMKLTDVTDYDCLYFQHNDEESLHMLCTQVNAHCLMDTTPYCPVERELVCALFSNDSAWYRAEVLEINQDDYVVRFLDYGNCEIVKCDGIRKIDKSLITVPRFAVPCHVKDVDLKSLPRETFLEFAKMTLTEVIKVQAVEKIGSTYGVILYTLSGTNINQKFCTKDSVKVPSQLATDIIMASSVSIKSLPLDGRKVEMSITDATSLDKIYLQYYGAENQKVLAEQLVEMFTYCQGNTTPYKPVKGELVCAMFDEAWYRAEVVEVLGDTYRLLYIDYGNTADVKLDLIRKINPSLASDPRHAVCCRIYQVDLKTLSPEKLQLFAELAINHMIEVEAVELQEQCYVVKLFTLDGCYVNEQFMSVKIQSDIILASSLPRVTLPVGGEPFDAVITEVMEDCTFYLQAHIQEAHRNLNEILGHLHRYCSSNHTPHKPVKGELVCAQYHSDQVWYRAEVEDIMGDRYSVQYIDFGNREVATESVIRKMDPSFTTHPIQSINCCLFDIPPSGEVGSLLKSLKDVEVDVKVVKKENDLYHLIIYSKNVNINEQMQEAVRSQDKEQFPLSNHISIANVKKTLPQGESFSVVITNVVSPSEIYCQLADSEAIEKLAALMQSMMCRCDVEDVDENFRPRVGDLVCAYYQVDGGWYRGCVIEAYKNDTYLIQYSDFGNSEVLPLDQIRSMLPEYIEMPILAFKCSLADLSPLGTSWDTAANEKVKLFQERKLMAYVVRRKEDFFAVDLVDEMNPNNKISISDLLVSDGNAKRSTTGVPDEHKKADLIQQQIEALQAQLASLGKK